MIRDVLPNPSGENKLGREDRQWLEVHGKSFQKDGAELDTQAGAQAKADAAQAAAIAHANAQDDAHSAADRNRANHTGAQAISTVTGLQAALDARAPLASPALTGNPTAPTQAAGNNSTRLANTAFVQAALAALVDSSPTALDTLNELAAALGDDPNFATTVTNALTQRAVLGESLDDGVLPMASSEGELVNSGLPASDVVLQGEAIADGNLPKVLPSGRLGDSGLVPENVLLRLTPGRNFGGTLTYIIPADVGTRMTSDSPGYLSFFSADITSEGVPDGLIAIASYDDNTLIQSETFYREMRSGSTALIGIIGGQAHELAYLTAGVADVSIGNIFSAPGNAFSEALTVGVPTLHNHAMRLSGMGLPPWVRADSWVRPVPYLNQVVVPCPPLLASAPIATTHADANAGGFQLIGTTYSVRLGHGAAMFIDGGTSTNTTLRAAGIINDVGLATQFNPQFEWATAMRFRVDASLNSNARALMGMFQPAKTGSGAGTITPNTAGFAGLLLVGTDLSWQLGSASASSLGVSASAGDILELEIRAGSGSTSHIDARYAKNGGAWQTLATNANRGGYYIHWLGGVMQATASGGAGNVRATGLVFRAAAHNS